MTENFTEKDVERLIEFGTWRGHDLEREARELLEDNEEYQQADTKEKNDMLHKVYSGLFYARLDEIYEKATGKNKKVIKEYLPKLQHFKYGNTKIENELKKPERNIIETIKKGGFQADIRSESDKKLSDGAKYNVIAHFSADDNVKFPEGFQYTLSKAFIVSAVGNAYDMATLETQSAGAKTIRADHLINIMNGDEETTSVRPERVQELIEEIEPLTSVRISIDAKGHKEYNAQGKNKVQLESATFTGYLLPIEIIELEELSKEKQVFIRILTRPALYDYADASGQIIKMDYKTLDLTRSYLEDGTEKRTDIKYMNNQTRAIRDLLLTDLYGRGRNLPYTEFTYSYIYAYVSADLQTDNPRIQTINKNIEKVAEALKQKGIIKKYTIHTHKNRLHKIRLHK